MTAKDLPTPATLRKLLSYDPDTGLMTWKHRPLEMFADERSGKIWNTRFSGGAAGSIRKDGYFRLAIFDVRYLSHRVAWAMHHGEWPDDQVDHINGDPSDNRIENLRVVSNAENARNAKRAKNNTSGVTGVSLHSDGQKWVVQISMKGKSRYLGRFTNFDDAVAVRAAAEVKYGFHPNHGRPALA